MSKRVTPEIETFARIRVVGVGGSGGNAINHMINSKVKGAEFISVNTDAQDLHRSLAKKKIHIGKNVTKGLGAGMNPEIGRRAAEENREEIQEALKGSDMVFVTCGMGGGTGTGAAPIVAKIAKELGALTVAVVTKPFAFEGLQRSRIAEQGLLELKKEVDAYIVIQNDKILTVVDQNTTAKSAFAMCDDILRQAVEGVSDIITTPGDINTDFNDIKTVVEGAGPTLMGIGISDGDDRAKDAAEKAIRSPLLDISISGAKGVLIAVAGSDDLGILEVQQAIDTIKESVGNPEAKIIFGVMKDEKLKKGFIRIIVIATGFIDKSGKDVDRSASIFSMGGSVKEKEKEEKAGGQIFNSIMERRREETTEEVEEEEAPEVEGTEEETFKQVEERPSPHTRHLEEDDEAWQIPSFLRRKKK
jgi:cell division protein FtsZ